MKRRTFLQLLTLLSIGAILPPHTARGVAEFGNTYLNLTPDLAVEFATRFSRHMLDEQCLATNPVLAYDSVGAPVGYTVDIQRDGSNYGYIVLDSRHPNIVTSYSFGNDVVSPIEALRSDSSMMQKAPNISRDCTSKLIMFSPLDFGIANEMLTEYVTPSAASIGKLPRKVGSQPKPEWGDIPVSVRSFYKNYVPISETYVGDFNFTNMNEIRNNTGKYACAVTALFMIAGNTVCNNHFLINCSNWYNQIPDWNEYSVIWDATETTVIQNSNSSASSAVQLGITKDDKIGPGFVDYCKGKSFNLSESHWRSPTFQQYISQVSNIQHSVFTARIKKPSGEIEGHSMAVAGYCTAADANEASNVMSFLNVYDGWNGMAFVDFNYSGWVSTFGTFFQTS